MFRYESFLTHSSKLYPGVRFTVRRMSFARRCELAHRVRDLSQKIEFLRAGESVQEKLEGAVLNSEISNLYLSWGLVSVEGMDLDGQPATPELVLESGPEDLCNEIVAAIQAECGLSQEERKN
jgi:hypothetical protein